MATHTAIRYLQPLREGGSLPAVVDTDGGGLFVVKFRGAGILRGSRGVNVGLRYLDGAFNFDLAAAGVSSPRSWPRGSSGSTRS